MLSKAINFEWFTPEVRERFWSHVDKSAGPDKCWLWTKYRDKDGYGTWGIRTEFENVAFRCHRLAYCLHYNIDPAPNLVLHKCDNTSCCNPDHLYIGDFMDNNQDTSNRGKCSLSTHYYKGPMLKGSNHPESKLTEDDVKTIRELAKTQWYPEIARRYNVSTASICNIVKRKSWKHI